MTKFYFYDNILYVLGRLVHAYSYNSPPSGALVYEKYLVTLPNGFTCEYIANDIRIYDAEYIEQEVLIFDSELFLKGTDAEQNLVKLDITREGRFIPVDSWTHKIEIPICDVLNQFKEE